MFIRVLILEEIKIVVGPRFDNGAILRHRKRWRRLIQIIRRYEFNFTRFNWLQVAWIIWRVRAQTARFVYATIKRMHIVNIQFACEIRLQKRHWIRFESTKSHFRRIFFSGWAERQILFHIEKRTRRTRVDLCCCNFNEQRMLFLKLSNDFFVLLF